MRYGDKKGRFRSFCWPGELKFLLGETTNLEEMRGRKAEGVEIDICRSEYAKIDWWDTGGVKCFVEHFGKCLRLLLILRE